MKNLNIDELKKDVETIDQSILVLSNEIPSKHNTISIRDLRKPVEFYRPEEGFRGSFQFETRDKYVTWRGAWRRTYSTLSQAIRQANEEYRKCQRERNFHGECPAAKTLHEVLEAITKSRFSVPKEVARKMLMIRRGSKIGAKLASEWARKTIETTEGSSAAEAAVQPVQQNA